MANDEELARIKAAIEAEIAEWAEQAAVIGQQPDYADHNAKVIAEAFHRRGVPVVRSRVEGDAIVFDVADPAGEG